MRLFGPTTLCLLAAILPAAAADVDFTGTVTSSCSIVASTNGTLALNLTTGSTLGSEEAGGLAGTVTILSIGAGPVGYVTAN